MSMAREIARWEGCSPEIIASGSTAQTKFCIEDAQHDILLLWGLNVQLLAALAFYRDGFDYTKNKRYGGLEYKPRPSLLDDCGNIAMSALRAADEALK